MEQNKKPDFPIGYKKPPRQTQFKPGQSGNPKGRPKEFPSFSAALSKHVRKKVTVTMGDKARQMQMLDAIAMKHVSKAANGDPKSTAIVLKSLEPMENRKDNHLPELLQEFRSIHARGRRRRTATQSAAADNAEKKDK